MRRRTMRWVVMLLCALVFVGCGSGTGGSTPPTVTPSPITPKSLPPAGTVSATIPSVVGGDLTYGIAADDTAVWAHNANQGTVSRIDPKTNKVVATILVGHGEGRIALEAGFVWVLNHDDSTISKIDPQTNQVVDTIALPPPEGFLAVSPGAVWVASHVRNEVRKIDPHSDQVIATISIPYGPSWMSFGAGSLWICDTNSILGVLRLDPTTNEVLTQIDISGGKGYACDGIAASDAGVWAGLSDSAEDFDLGLVHIDPATNKVLATIPLPQSRDSSGDAANLLAADAQGVWSAKQGMGLFRIGLKTNRAAGFLDLQGASGVTVGAGSVWIAMGDGSLLRITPAA